MRNASTVRLPLFLTLCATLGAACSESPGGQEPATTDMTMDTTTSIVTDTTVPTTGNTTSTVDTTSMTVDTTSMTGTTSMTTTTTMDTTTTTTTTMDTTTTTMDTTTTTMDTTTTTMDTTSTMDTDETSSGGETTGSEMLEPMTFAEVRAFLDAPIAGGGSCFNCHAEGGDLPQVFRDDDMLYETLTTRTVEHCEDRLLVVPGDPENSALYLVLQGPCGAVSKMPHGCVENEFENSCTNPDDRERLRLWIEAGAPQ